MNYDPLKLIDESYEETAERLRGLARAELEEAVASGEAVATAFDGSLSTGKFWPSSDMDVTIVVADDNAHALRGAVRAGIGIHEHVQGFGFLERLRRGYPESWSIPADTKWYWLQDAIWVLDGVASLTPVHDPGGKLADLKEFVRARRFSPEAVAPRRPAILRGAAAATKFDYFATAGELVASIWLEAAERIISGKEMDPELRAACAAAGFPEAHALFRRVMGVDAIEGRETEFARACRAMLEVFSPWVDALLAKVPFKRGGIEDPIPMALHMRQSIWSGLYAPERGCLLHLAGIKRLFGEDEASPAVLAKLAAGPGGELIERLPKIEEARREILAFFPVDPGPRQAAFDELVALTRRIFSIEG